MLPVSYYSGKRMTSLIDSRLAKYKHLRQISKEYLSGLVSSSRRPEVDLKEIGRFFGIYKSGTMMFHDETEVSVMMDFTICERLYNGKSLIDIEMESANDLDANRMTILTAFRDGYTSLFEVLETRKKENTIRMYDLLRDNDKEIIDINLSQTVDKKRLLFLRYIDFQEFSMSSGLSFVYGSSQKETLLRRYRTEIRTRFKIDKPITRFLIFHRLNQQFGQEVVLL
jgi:hypothetical protein